MLSTLKDTAKDSILYGLGNIAAKALGFILVPIYIKTLSLADFGILSLTEVVIQLIVPVMGMAVYTALSRWYWDKEHIKKQKTVFKTSAIVVFVLSGFLLIISLFLVKQLAFLLFVDVGYKYLLTLIFISAFLQANLNIPFTLIRLKKKALQYSTINLLKLLIIFSLTIYFIVYNDYGIEGIYYAQIIGNIGILILFIYIVKDDLKGEIEYAYIKPMLKYSAPLAISATSAIILTISDRFSIRYILGFEQTGIYSLGYKISSVLKLVFLTSFQMAFVPIIYQAANKEGFTRFLSKLNSYSAIILIYASLVVGLFSKEIIQIITSKSEFTDNYIYLIVPILNLSLVFDLIRYNISFGLNLAKKTGVLSSIIVAMSVLNIILNVMFIKMIGTIGAALATLVVQFLYVIVNYKVTNRYYKIQIETGNLIKVTLLYLLFISSLVFMPDLAFIHQLAVKLLLTVLFPFILYIFWSKEDIEKQRIEGFIHKYLKINITLK